MMFEKMSFSEGLAFVAERLVNNQLLKEANDPVQAAQSARAQLGILGVPQNELNDLVSKHRKGELSDTGAKMRFTRLPPGIGTQIGNIPNAVGVAAGEGRIGDVVGQLDVAGLKNLNPFENPVTATMAAGTGLGAHALAGRYQHVKDIKDLIRGSVGTEDHLMEAIGKGGEKSTVDPTKKLLAEHRVGLPPKLPIEEKLINWWNSPKSTEPMLSRIGGAVKDKLQIPKELHGIDGSVTRNHHQAALNRLYKERGGKPWLPIIAGLAAGTAPLLAQEWLSPSGYRSGRNPFNTLLQTNKELNSKDAR